MNLPRNGCSRLISRSPNRVWCADGRGVKLRKPCAGHIEHKDLTVCVRNFRHMVPQPR